MKQNKVVSKKRKYAMAAWLQAITHGLQDYRQDPFTVGQAEELLQTYFKVDAETAKRVVVIAALTPQETLNPDMRGKMPEPSRFRQW